MRARFCSTAALLAPLVLWGCTGSPGLPQLADGGGDGAPPLDVGSEVVARSDASVTDASAADGDASSPGGDASDGSVVDAVIADATDASGEVDGPASVNQRSFVVTSVATPQADAGAFPSPVTHRFTVVLDWNRR